MITTNKDTNNKSREAKNMKTYRIEAATREQFNSLIKDYREDGYMIITYGYFLAELEKGDDFIIIEWDLCK